MLFIDVYTGEAGSSYDLTLFRRSDIYDRHINDEVLFPNDSYLIGDWAYQLSDTLMVGFENYGNLSVCQKKL